MKLAHIVIRHFIAALLCISCVDAISQEWVWAVGSNSVDYFPGNSSNGIAMDSESNLYVIGVCNEGTTFQTLTSNVDGMFLAKYDESGSIQWLKVVANAHPSDICVGPQNQIIVVGTFKDTCDFGSDEFISETRSAFTVQYDSDGNAHWARAGYSSSFWGCSNLSVAADGSGNVFVVGHTEEVSNYDGNSIGQIDHSELYIVKYDLNGAIVDHLSYASGDHYQLSYALLTCDDSGNIYVTGAWTC